MKSIIRWIFVVLFVAFLAAMKEMNLLYRYPNIFLILLLLASGLAVLGVVFFRDGVMSSDGSEPAPESAKLLEVKNCEVEEREECEACEKT
jgi:cytochrome b561